MLVFWPLYTIFSGFVAARKNNRYGQVFIYVFTGGSPERFSLVSHRRESPGIIRKQTKNASTCFQSVNPGFHGRAGCFLSSFLPQTGRHKNCILKPVRSAKKRAAMNFLFLFSVCPDSVQSHQVFCSPIIILIFRLPPDDPQP